MDRYPRKKLSEQLENLHDSDELSYFTKLFLKCQVGFGSLVYDHHETPKVQEHPSNLQGKKMWLSRILGKS